MALDQKRLEELGRELLLAIGEDPTRSGITGTPRRWAKWWSEFMDFDPGKVDVLFESQHTSSMVIVAGIKVWSLCEHHLLPFNCEVAIGYVPNGEVLGLSKFARIAHKVAHGLQVQERMTEQIATEVQTVTGSGDVIVVGRGEHLCGTMRGIKTHMSMRTIATRGSFDYSPDLRMEFYKLAGW